MRRAAGPVGAGQADRERLDERREAEALVTADGEERSSAAPSSTAGSLDRRPFAVAIAPSGGCRARERDRAPCPAATMLVAMSSSSGEPVRAHAIEIGFVCSAGDAPGAATIANGGVVPPSSTIVTQPSAEPRSTPGARPARVPAADDGRRRDADLACARGRGVDRDRERGMAEALVRHRRSSATAYWLTIARRHGEVVARCACIRAVARESAAGRGSDARPARRRRHARRRARPPRGAAPRASSAARASSRASSAESRTISSLAQPPQRRLRRVVVGPEVGNGVEQRPRVVRRRGGEDRSVASASRTARSRARAPTSLIAAHHGEVMRDEDDRHRERGLRARRAARGCSPAPRRRAPRSPRRRSARRARPPARVRARRAASRRRSARARRRDAIEAGRRTCSSSSATRAASARPLRPRNCRSGRSMIGPRSCSD